MAKTGFLKGSDKIPFLPITRAELVKDSGGKCAFQSDTFLATSTKNGILSYEDKDKLDKMVGIHFITEDEESIPESHFNISFASIDDDRVDGGDAFYVTFPYGDGTSYGAQIAIDDCSNPTILVRGKSSDSDGEWGSWYRVLLENDSVKNPNALTINRYGVEVAKYDGSVAKAVDLTPIALSGTSRITNAESRNLEHFPKKYNLAVGYWAGETATDTCNFNTRYGTTLDLSYNTWYQRLAFDTTDSNGKRRIEYLIGINTENETEAALEKVGDLAYLSDIPTYCANILLKNESDDTAEAKFKSVTAKTYNVQNDDASSFTVSYFTGEDYDYLSIGKVDEQILLVNDSHIIPGNDDMTLGDSDHMWNSVYATTFRTTPNEVEGFKPLCVTSEGNISTYADNVGANYQPVYVVDGKITAFSGNKGSATQGLYITDGKFTPMTYTLGAHVSATNDTTLGKLVLFNAATTKMYPYNTGLGSGTNGIYINNTGVPTEMTYSLNATVQSGTQGKLAYYSEANAIDDFSSSIGASYRPVWIDGGVPRQIALTASTETLYVTGWKSNTGLYTGTQTTSGVRMVGGNTLYAAGGFYESSDETLKDFTEDVDVDLNALSNIPKKYFTWKNDKSKSTNIGTSAQELQKLYPELVSKDESGFLNVAYDKLSIIALAAIDKLHKEISELKQVNNDLLVRIQQLENIKANGERN